MGTERSSPNAGITTVSTFRYLPASGFFSMRVCAVAIAAVCTVSASVLPACGGRGPLDDDRPLGDVTDAGVSSVARDATASDATIARDAGGEAGSILGCGTCLFDECSAGIVACIQDATCRATFQCVVTDCLRDGSSPSPACLFKCAAGDIAGALKIVQVFQCVTTTCGADCNPLLSGLGAGANGDGGARGRTPFASALSRWPDLCER